MADFIKTVTETRDRIDRIFKILAIILFLFVILLTISQVLSRYVLKFPIAFSDEVSRFLFIWISFMGAAMVMKDDEHIRLDIITESLSPFMQLVLKNTIQLMIFIFCLTVTIQGVKLLHVAAKQVAPVSRISMGIVYSVIPLSFALMSIYALCLMLISFHDYMKKGDNQS